ncbi:MAG: Na/Pi cotransporter family protein [Clostridia bacterium]|nr:Na/Pi cotransporter family protein [Clostridia bacterium]
MNGIIFAVITLLGGLAFFLYGMNVMSSGLEKMAKGKLEKSLIKVTSKKFLALVFGAGITIAIQSSSALTVMLVGLVNSGLLDFGQTIGVLMGSNIGTTLTAWILSLAGIEGDNLVLELLKPKNFSLVFALVGILMIMAAKKRKNKDIGSILVGFAVLMFGMTLMSDAMEPLTKMEGFTSLLTAFENPFLAVAFGAVFTGIIQSSAASVGILQTAASAALATGGGVTYGMAIPIIMGQNIGTCVTAIISSIGVSRNAKKVAVVHLSFNIIGTLICLIPFCILSYVVDIPFLKKAITPFEIAIVHSIFNVFTTALLFPFTKMLEAIANKIVPEVDGEKQGKLLDERLLTVPSFAVTNALDVVVEMSEVSQKAFEKAVALVGNYNDKEAAEVSEMETLLDNYEDQLGTYMVKISSTGVSDSDSKKIAKILHTINDFERIGDHAENLVDVAREINDKKIVFSHEATAEIAVLKDAVLEILRITDLAFRNNDLQMASSVEPLEQVIDDIIADIKSHHVSRLQHGNCTIELGFVLTDLLTNYERVSDHCSNVAVAIIESQHGTFEAHEYLSHVKNDPNSAYTKAFEEYKQKFAL